MIFFKKTCLAGLCVCLSNILIVSTTSASPKAKNKTVDDTQIRLAYDRLLKISAKPIKIKKNKKSAHTNKVTIAKKKQNVKKVTQDLQIAQAYYQLFKKPSTKKTIKYKRTATKNKKIPARFRAVAVAKKQIRKKYRWGGSTPRTGFDCSGLTYYAFKSVNINIPRTARAQYKHTKRISLAKLQAGDLIFFHTRRTKARVNHVGIYLGGGKFIHAPRRGKPVSIAKFSRYWRRKAIGAGRV